MSWFLKHFVLLAPYVCSHIFSYVKVTEWPPIGKIAAHSAYEKVQVGKDQEKAQSEKDSHSKNRGGKKPN